MKYTVGLYDGGMCYVKHLVATKVVEAEDFKDINPVAQFYDIVEITDHCTTYKNRITNKCFNVYYFRVLHPAEDIRTYDFGSYSRFCGIIKGDYSEVEFTKLINERNK